MCVFSLNSTYPAFSSIFHTKVRSKICEEGALRAEKPAHVAWTLVRAAAIAFCAPWPNHRQVRHSCRNCNKQIKAEIFEQDQAVICSNPSPDNTQIQDIPRLNLFLGIIAWGRDCYSSSRLWQRGNTTVLIKAAQVWHKFDSWHHVLMSASRGKNTTSTVN